MAKQERAPGSGAEGGGAVISALVQVWFWFCLLCAFVWICLHA